MYWQIFEIPVMRWIFRTAKAIPIAGARENPELMQRAFAEIDAALAAGEVVGIFPEGALTQDGDIAPFKSGIERILASAPRAGGPDGAARHVGSMWSRARLRAWAACARRDVSARTWRWSTGAPVDGRVATRSDAGSAGARVARRCA